MFELTEQGLKNFKGNSKPKSLWDLQCRVRIAFEENKRPKSEEWYCVLSDYTIDEICSEIPIYKDVVFSLKELRDNSSLKMKEYRDCTCNVCNKTRNTKDVNHYVDIKSGIITCDYCDSLSRNGNISPQMVEEFIEKQDEYSGEIEDLITELKAKILLSKKKNNNIEKYNAILTDNKVSGIKKDYSCSHCGNSDFYLSYFNDMSTNEILCEKCIILKLIEDEKLTVESIEDIGIMLDR